MTYTFCYTFTAVSFYKPYNRLKLRFTLKMKINWCLTSQKINNWNPVQPWMRYIPLLYSNVCSVTLQECHIKTKMALKKKISADKAFHHQWKKKKTKQKLKSNKKFSTIAHHLVAGNEEQNMNKNTTINIVL